MKHTGRLLLALLTSLILGLGALVAVGGTANAATSSGPCATQRAHVHKAQHRVNKDKKKLKRDKKAHRHHAVTKDKKKLHRDQRHLKKAKRALKTCRANHANTGGSTGGDNGGTTTPEPSNPAQPLIDACYTIAKNDPSQQFTAACDQFAAATAGSGSASPLQPLIDGCYQAADQDPSGQFKALCDAFAGGASGGSTGSPTDQLKAGCATLAANDPSNSLVQLCDGLGALPVAL